MNKFVYNAPTEWTPKEYYPDLSSEKLIAIDLETCDRNLTTHGSGWATGDGYVTGIAVATADWQGYYPIAHGGGNLNKKKVLDWFKSVAKLDCDKIFHNASYDLGWLRSLGITVNGKIHDTMISSALIDENRYSFTLNSLAKEKLGETKNEDLLYKAAKEFGVDPKKEMYKLPSMHVGEYAEYDARLTYDLYVFNKKEIDEQNLHDIYDLETRLQPCLIDMRANGVRVDLEQAEVAKKLLSKREKELMQEIKKMCGMDIEIWAAASIAKAFDHLNIPYPRTPKSGAPSFTKNFLSSNEHEIAQKIVEAREMNKANTTFIETILRHQHKGRIHSEIHQMRSDDGGTVTGRFSYSNPNLQQIPARNEDIKKLIRSLFIPEEGKQWGMFDYSQQEPRLVVHYAFCDNLDVHSIISGYREGDADFHQMVADIAQIPRGQAKTINLGLFYGMGKNKLMNELGIESAEAEEIINTYQSKVPFVKQLTYNVMDKASARGEIKTLLGRHCRFPFYEPREFGKKGFYKTKEEAIGALGHGNYKRAGTYKAMNKLIQGSAADQTKKAMVDLYEQDGIIPHIQVHDELNISVENKSEALNIKNKMETCVDLHVPSKVDYAIVKNWGEAK
jgi:DNA polymerase I-like protein with 3'-5' exonuclease and polymerase domains